MNILKYHSRPFLKKRITKCSVITEQTQASNQTQRPREPQEFTCWHHPEMSLLLNLSKRAATSPLLVSTEDSVASQKETDWGPLGKSRILKVKLKIQVEHAFPKTLGRGVFRIWDFFRFWNVIIYIMRSWGWDPSLDIRFPSVSYTPYKHNLKVILYIFLVYLWADSDLLHDTRGGIFHFGISCQDSESFKFWVLFLFLFLLTYTLNFPNWLLNRLIKLRLH